MTTSSSPGSHALSDDALRLLKDLQAGRGFFPDEGTEAALSAALSAMAELLYSERLVSDQRYLLSSLDPGKGKTEAVCMFLKAWKTLNFHPGGGVLIAVSRLDEIEAYIDRSGLDDGDLAILVAKDHPLNTRGLKEPSDAPVLFTTHEMIRRRCRSVEAFADLSCYHYQGHPRTCRIWDEAMLPAQPVTLRLDAIQGLLEPLRPASPSTAERLEVFVDEVIRGEPGATLRAPLILWRPENVGTVFQWPWMERWSKLVSLGGREVQAVSSNLHGYELVAAVDALPDDFAPAVILDASGRVRETYKLWEANKGNLLRLPSASNDYSKLTIYHWDRPTSRSTFADPKKRRDLLQVAADLINAEPDKEWLVIHHKARGDFDPIQELLPLVQGDRGRVSSCNWGNHHGTNAFRMIDRVIVLGLWHQSEAGYRALSLAAGGSQTSPVNPAEVERLKIGEHQHHLLQAICRSSVRNAHAGACGSCTVYLVGRFGRDTRSKLAESFPGVQIKPWAPLEAPLRGKAKEVADVLTECFSSPEVRGVKKIEVRTAVGFRRSQDLAQVLSRADVQGWLEQNRLTTTTREIVRMAA